MSSHRTATMSSGVLGGGVLLAVALLLTGCAGNSKSTSAAAGARGSSGGSTSVTSSGTTASATSTKAPTLDTSGSFCDLAKSVQKSETDSISALTGPDSATALKTLEEQAASELQVFVAKAPAEIKGQVEVIAGAEQTFFNQLKAADFNFANIATTAEASLDTPAFQQATTAIEAYLAKTCGITVSDAPTG